jgi:hypothetical protein
MPSRRRKVREDQVRNDFSSLILQVEFGMAFEPRRDSFRVAAKG